MISEHDAFELRNVTVQYASVTALRDVSLSIRQGEQVALVGPSGAGKTTLLQLLNGTALVTAGKIFSFGNDTQNLSRQSIRRLRSEIGVVYQELRLVPNLRVSQNVLAGRFGRQSFLSSLKTMIWPSRSQIASVHRLLDRVGIEEKLFERTDRLSGGQQQRVAIARALIQQPKAILADEPVSSVDPARARESIRLLREISETDGLTLCVSLHNLELAKEFFPRLIGLKDGAVAFDSSANKLSDSQFDELYKLSHKDRL